MQRTSDWEQPGSPNARASGAARASNTAGEGAEGEKKADPNLGTASHVRKSALQVAAIDIAFGGIYAILVFFGQLLSQKMFLKVQALGFFRIDMTALEITISASFTKYLESGIVQKIVELADPNEQYYVKDALGRLPSTFSALDPQKTLCSPSGNFLSNTLRSVQGEKICSAMAPEIQFCTRVLLLGIAAYLVLTFVAVQCLLYYAARSQAEMGDRKAPGKRWRIWFIVLHTLGCFSLSLAALSYLFGTSHVPMQLSEWSIMGTIASITNIGLFKSAAWGIYLFFFLPLLHCVIILTFYKGKKFHRKDEYDSEFTRMLEQFKKQGGFDMSYGATV